MTVPINTAPPRGGARRSGDEWLAGPMFFLAQMFLVVLAGLIHRYPRLDPNDPEAYLILGALGVLWLPLLLDAVFRYRLRDRDDRSWKPLLAAAACALVPPLRMGCRGLARPDHIWLPGLGWREVDHRLRRTLERFFSIPMIGFALMVLPLLALEYCWAEKIREEPVLALWFDIGTAVVWLAFSVELIVMVAVSDRPLRYCFLHWIDLAIVLLPAVEVLPLFRLLRLGRVLRLEQLLRWGRLHRLQALATRGWRALLLLRIAQRLTGRSSEHRLEQLRELLRAKEEEAADLREEIKKLEDSIAQKAMHHPAAAPSA
jgi:hypothetical protein